MSELIAFIAARGIWGALGPIPALLEALSELKNCLSGSAPNIDCLLTIRA